MAGRVARTQGRSGAWKGGRGWGSLGLWNAAPNSLGSHCGRTPALNHLISANAVWVGHPELLPALTWSPGVAGRGVSEACSL